MGFKEDVARRIERKRSEISDLEEQLKTARTYLQAFEDMYKLAARESGTSVVTSGTPADKDGVRPSTFRVGSMTQGVYEALKAAGRPLHVNELLRAIGREVTRAEKSAVSGTLAGYVKEGKIFTRPAPNTFGLAEFQDQEQPQAVVEPAPPLGFGAL